MQIRKSSILFSISKRFFLTTRFRIPRDSFHSSGNHRFAAATDAVTFAIIPMVGENTRVTNLCFYRSYLGSAHEEQ